MISDILKGLIIIGIFSLTAVILYFMQETDVGNIEYNTQTELNKYNNKVIDNITYTQNRIYIQFKEKSVLILYTNTSTIKMNHLKQNKETK